jgi:hypothetical protein
VHCAKAFPSSSTQAAEYECSRLFWTDAGYLRSVADTLPLRGKEGSETRWAAFSRVGKLRPNLGARGS